LFKIFEIKVYFDLKPIDKKLLKNNSNQIENLIKSINNYFKDYEVKVEDYQVN
jgi:hypothetical protein